MHRGLGQVATTGVPQVRTSYPNARMMELVTMPDPAQRFDAQKGTVREQIEEAIRAYQKLATMDLTDITRDNATEMYQAYVEVEIAFEGVGGVLDAIRQAMEQAGECFTDQLELVGFSGEKSPIVADVDEDEE